MKQKIVGPILAVMLLSSLWGIIYARPIWSPSPVSAHESLIKLRSGQPPDAQNDSYAVDKNTTLTVGDSNANPPGVLANDFDLEGDTLTAGKISNPANGKLTSFGGDGSFTYTPNNNFSGIDTFIYNADDGTNTSQAQVTIYVRSVVFREDTDEIKVGECVNFSWAIKGDIDIIEFEVFDDNKNPFLIQNSTGNRQECPIKNTRYQLIVRWLDGSSDKKEIIEIKVEESDGTTGSGSSSSTGTGGATVVEGTVAPVGPFFLVTPVLITNAPGMALVATPVPEAAPVSNTASSAVPKPTGVLESITALPETGSLPAFSQNPISESGMVWSKESGGITQPYNNELWVTPLITMGILLGTFLVGITIFRRGRRQSD